MPCCPFAKLSNYPSRHLIGLSERIRFVAALTYTSHANNKWCGFGKRSLLTHTQNRIIDPIYFIKKAAVVLGFETYLHVLVLFLLQFKVNKNKTLNWSFLTRYPKTNVAEGLRLVMLTKAINLPEKAKCSLIVWQSNTVYKRQKRWQ